jgi:hypothetical protein
MAANSAAFAPLLQALRLCGGEKKNGKTWVLPFPQAYAPT